ncbi:MAG: phospholipid scramblase-related protein [Flavobacterium sp.]|nr:phospholipid scramblase-related protein [Flavobacterium sp.]
MNSILSKNVFLVKEHIGMFKASNNFDIFNPESGSLLMTCREPNLGFFTKMFRFTDYKKMTPFHIIISDLQGKKILSVKRGFTVFRSDVTVFDENDKPLGVFKQKFFSFGGKFEIHDANDRNLCTLQGKWTGWDFKFIKDGKELAHVSKKWAGIGKEFFTSADNYVLEIYNHVPEDAPIRALILASVMCIDMVFKE